MSNWRILQPWLSSLCEQPLRLLLGFSLLAVTVLSGIALLGLSGWFITAAAVFVVAFDIFLPGAGIRAFALIRTVSRYFERVVHHDVILRLQHRWRVRLFSGLLKQPQPVVERFRVAHVLQNFSQDLASLDDLYIRVLAPSLTTLLATLLVGLGLLFLDLRLALLVWGAGAVILLASLAIMSQRLSRMAAAELEATEQLRHAAMDMISSKAELIAWRALPDAVSNVENASTQLVQQQHKLRRSLWLQQQVIEFVAMMVLLAVIGGALILALQGSFSIALAVFAGLLVLALQEQWLLLPQASVLWGRVTGAATRLRPMLNGVTDSKKSASKLPASGEEKGQNDDEMGQPAPSIALRHIQVEDRGLPGALSLNLEPACVHLLAGRTGLGKSTLLNVLAGRLAIDAGEIEVTLGERPVDITDVSCAMLTQHNAILSQTVAANLRLERHHCSDDELWAMLERVELADTVSTLARQLDTWIGEGGVQLSGGQQRRLALARTMLHASNKSLVLLDEPFNGVSQSQAERIWLQLLPLLRGKTVVIVSHASLDSSPAAIDAIANIAPDVSTGIRIVQRNIELCYDCAP